MYITIGVGEMNNTKSHYPCPLCPLHAYYTVCGILFCKPQVSVFGWTFRNELWIKPSKVVCWVLRILSYFFFFYLLLCLLSACERKRSCEGKQKLRFSASRMDLMWWHNKMKRLLLLFYIQSIPMCIQFHMLTSTI